MAAWTAPSSAVCVSLAAHHPGLFATVGIHPNNLTEASPSAWEEVLALGELLIGAARMQDELFIDCAIYPDAVAGEGRAKAVRGTALEEETRFTAGGDAFYVLDPSHYGVGDGAGFAIRSAVLLNQLGYVSVAFAILSGASLPADRIETLLHATAPVDTRPLWKRALKSHLPPSAYRGLRRLRQWVRSGV